MAHDLATTIDRGDSAVIGILDALQKRDKGAFIAQAARLIGRLTGVPLAGAGAKHAVDRAIAMSSWGKMQAAIAELDAPDGAVDRETLRRLLLDVFQDELTQRHAELIGGQADILAAVAELRALLTSPVPRTPDGLRVDIARLPNAASKEFVGRRAELDALHCALEDKGCGVYVIVAAGGTGKTALVTRWLDELMADGWPGLRRSSRGPSTARG